MTITLPLIGDLAERLQSEAEAQHITVENLALNILYDALGVENTFPTPEEVVAKIKATPPNPAMIRPATGSLEEALLNAPEDPDFDLETWTRAWEAFEAQMKAIDRANDIAEGLV
jgi:hypothetical protein